MRNTELVQHGTPILTSLLTCSGTSSCVNADLDRYFQFLSDNPTELYTYCWMDSESKGVIAGYGVMHGRKEDMAPPVSGATLHVVLGITDLKGKKKENIQGVRVFCVDLDKETSRETLREIVGRYKVQLVVESSHGKFHLYWRANPKTRQEHWKLVQAGVARLLGGDINLSQINHSIRVPGVVRVCKDGSEFVPAVVWDVGEYEELEVSDLEGMVPGLLELGEKALLGERRGREKIALSTEKAIATNNPKLVAKQIDKIGKRNDGIFGTVFKQVVKGGMGGTGNGHGLVPCVSEGEAEDWGGRVNAELSEPLDEFEVRKASRSAWDSAVLKMESKEGRENGMLEEGHGESGEGGGRESRESGEGSVGALTGSTTVFPYDYSKGALGISRFSDRSVVERVLQRYEGHVVRVGRVLYAFDSVIRIWRAQRPPYEMLGEMIEECCKDVISDPLFLTQLCMGDGGLVSEVKRKRFTDKFESDNTSRAALNVLIRNNTFPRLTNSDFDTAPTLLLTGSGVLNMESGEVREATAADRMLQSTEVMWDGEADYSWWETFLGQVFELNEKPIEMIDFMKKLFGYSLTTSISARKIFIHYGSGSNGKSKVLEALEMICGTYCTRVECSALSKNKNAVQKEFTRLGPKLEGKRVAIIDDLDTAAQWNEGFVKTLTGKKIQMRKLYEEEVDISNSVKFHIGCNEVPRPESENFAISSRLCIIPYNKQFNPLSSEDDRIKKGLADNASGILRWAVEGYRELMARGGNLPLSEEMDNSIDEYKAEHFTKESKVLSMFSKPESLKEGAWEDIADLTLDVNATLQGESNISRIQLGRILSDKLKLSSERPRVDGKRITLYSVKLNYKRRDVDKLFNS